MSDLLKPYFLEDKLEKNRHCQIIAINFVAN